MTRDEMLEAMARAMQESPAWPAVFNAGAAHTLALAAFQSVEDKPYETKELKDALKALWRGTVWGAGKAAVFESHKLTLLSAGIENIGD